MNNQTQHTYDYLIIGAGIIGMTVALELRKRQPQASIAIIEKESEVALHASGRNSGVLHAGFYYTADSLKARFTVEGNRRLKAFCKQHQIPVNACQKLVVAQNASEVKTLHRLYERGKKNGVDVTLISEQQAKQIEPNIKTYQQALLSPSTASVNPKQVCLKLKIILQQKDVTFLLNQQVNDILGNIAVTKTHNIKFNYLINAAGLYADKIAHKMGVGKDFTLIPFKGIYLKYQGDCNTIKTNIYPVPNLANPFLGVHFTKTATNDIKIGPTAMPAFWREHYHGLSNFKLKEFAQTIYYQAKLFIKNSFNFRNLAFNEIKKYNKQVFINEAKLLANNIGNQFKPTPAGIRAQLLNKHTNELVTDFIIEHTKNSSHILNAVSPAFTCSFALAEHIVNMIPSPAKSTTKTTATEQTQKDIK